MKKKRMRLLCVLLVGVIFFTGSITEGRICLYAAEDAAYTAELKKGGFPNSYVSALNALHKKYPKWKFEAVQSPPLQGPMTGPQTSGQFLTVPPGWGQIRNIFPIIWIPEIF